MLLTVDQRLDQARRLVDFPAQKRELLCDILASERDGTLKGIYADIPIEVYHHRLCSGYSSTLIKKLVEASFNRAKVELIGNDKALRFGSAFHAFCNEPQIFAKEYIVSPVNDSRTKEWQACVDSGKTVLSAKDFRTIEVMSRKVFSHPDIAPIMYGSEFEVTAFSQDPETGLWKKARADIKQSIDLYDLKTCANASEVFFTLDAKKFLYRISAAWYLGVFSEAVGVQFNSFSLIACEKEEPNDCALYRVSDFSIQKAKPEIRKALDLIFKILIDGPKAWTGYELGAKEILI